MNFLWSADVNINASLQLVILFKSMLPAVHKGLEREREREREREKRQDRTSIQLLGTD